MHLNLTCSRFASMCWSAGFSDKRVLVLAICILRIGVWASVFSWYASSMPRCVRCRPKHLVITEFIRIEATYKGIAPRTNSPLPQYSGNRLRRDSCLTIDAKSHGKPDSLLMLRLVTRAHLLTQPLHSSTQSNLKPEQVRIKCTHRAAVNLLRLKPMSRCT